MPRNPKFDKPAVSKLDLTRHQCFPDTFTELALDKYTFIYGPNGSGKSTVLRELRNDSRCANGQIDLRTFDQTFIRGLLNPEHSFEGILRVIDAPPEISARLRALTCQDGELNQARAKVQKLEADLAKFDAQITEKRKKFREKCWTLKEEVPKALLEVGTNLKIRNKERLAEKIEERCGAADAPSLETTDSFDALAQSLAEIGADGQLELKSAPAKPEELDIPDEIKRLSRTELRPDADNRLAQLLEQVGHSDWVKKGLEFLEPSSTVCPFCQQAVPDQLQKELRSLFAAEYDNAIVRLSHFKELCSDYQRQLDNLLVALEEYPNTVVGSLTTRIHDHKRFALELEKQVGAKLNDMTLTNVLSSITKPAPLANDYDELVARVEDINEKRRDTKTARKNLGDQVFDRFVAEKAAGAYYEFSGAIASAVKAKESLERKLSDATTALTELEREVRSLEAQTSSTKHVMDEVNSTLEALGFLNFSLTPFGDDGSHYRVIRKGGASAGPTLSEGEKTLVSFLYFFHGLSAASQDGADSRPILAVIDDPISSLDSTTLFAVSLLCRQLIETCTDHNSRLSQFILLTHNAYFFQEVTFLRQGKTRPQGCLYYTLRKTPDGMTTAHSHTYNPIVSAYEQLWSELRDDRQSGAMSVHTQNTMRRILETYFGSIGGFGSDVLSRLDPHEQLPAKSLLAWINDGSHHIPWNVDYSPTAVDSEFYHGVFRRIFEVEGQLGHYTKMMDSAYNAAV